MGVQWTLQRGLDDGNQVQYINIYVINSTSTITFFAGVVKGLESLWFIGDEFVDMTLATNLKHTRGAGDRPHVMEFYEILEFATTSMPVKSEM